MQANDQPGFSERAHRLFAAAQAEAARLQHEYIGTEHLLLGLTRDREGVPALVLRNLGVDSSSIPGIVEAVVPCGKDASETPYRPYTTGARQALELAHATASKLGHPWVGPEHLLLGLINEAHGPAAQILRQLGVTGDAARRETLRLLGTASV